MQVLQAESLEQAERINQLRKHKVKEANRDEATIPSVDVGYFSFKSKMMKSKKAKK